MAGFDGSKMYLPWMWADCYYFHHLDRPERKADPKDAVYDLLRAQEHWTVQKQEGRMNQPDPIPNDHPAMWQVVIEDMKARDQLGRERYKTPLQPFNGRDSLRDAYEEALDLAVYIRTAIYEREQLAKKST